MYDINNDNALVDFAENGLIFCNYKKNWRSAVKTQRVAYNIDKAQKELIDSDTATNGCLGVLGFIKTITPRNGNKPFDVFFVKHLYTNDAKFVYDADKVSYTARQFKGEIARDQKFNGFVYGDDDIEFKYVSNLQNLQNDLEGADFNIVKTKFDDFKKRKNVLTNVKIVVDAILNSYRIKTTVTNMLETKNLTDFDISVDELGKCIENICPKILKIGNSSYNKIGIDLNAYGKAKLLGSFVLSENCEIFVIFNTTNYTLENIDLNFDNKKFKFCEIIPSVEKMADCKLQMVKDYLYETENVPYTHREYFGSVSELEPDFNEEQYISNIIQNFV